MHFESYDERVWLDDAFLSLRCILPLAKLVRLVRLEETPRFIAELSDCDEMFFHHFVPLV